MDVADLLADGFGRIVPTARRLLDGLPTPLLTWRADPEANTIAWLLWHAGRGQDAQLAPLAGAEQVWLRDGWARRFDLPFADDASGYGQSSDEVAAVDVPADLLLGYLEAATQATTTFVAGLGPGDLDRVVDENWDPPVTLGARLVSILADDLQHLGQAAYVRGLAERVR